MVEWTVVDHVTNNGATNNETKNKKRFDILMFTVKKIYFINAFEKRLKYIC